MAKFFLQQQATLKLKQVLPNVDALSDDVVFTQSVDQIDENCINIVIKEQHIDALKEIFELAMKPNMSLIGKTHRGKVSISIDQISVIEAYGADVITMINNQEVQFSMKLYELESMLIKHGFIRVGKSTIINKAKIESVASSFNGKLMLYLTNNQKVEVNRTYTKAFKDAIAQGGII